MNKEDALDKLIEILKRDREASGVPKKEDELEKIIKNTLDSGEMKDLVELRQMQVYVMRKKIRKELQGIDDSMLTVGLMDIANKWNIELTETRKGKVSEILEHELHEKYNQLGEELEKLSAKKVPLENRIELLWE